jgi:hypothetical protein
MALMESQAQQGPVPVIGLVEMEVRVATVPQVKTEPTAQTEAMAQTPIT